MNRKRREQTLSFVRSMHKGQERAGGAPAWHHMQRVAALLEYAIDEEDVQKKEDIIIAGLGHDILEDTNADKNEVLACVGKRSYQYIWGMTNEWGDKNVEPYVKKITSSEEPVRVIKLADLQDNIQNVTYSVALLGTEWCNDFFLPIVTPMIKSLQKTSFNTYQRSSDFFLRNIDIGYKILLSEIENFQ